MKNAHFENNSLQNTPNELRIFMNKNAKYSGELQLHKEQIFDAYLRNSEANQTISFIVILCMIKIKMLILLNSLAFLFIGFLYHIDPAIFWANSVSPLIFKIAH